MPSYSKRINLKHNDLYPLKGNQLVGHLYSPRSKSVIQNHLKEFK